MISYTDFKDAVNSLFDAHNAYQHHKLDEYSGKTLYIDLHLMAQKLLSLKVPHEITPEIMMIHEKFEKFDINAEIVNHGIDNIDRSKMVYYFNILYLMRNRFFYFKMLSSFLANVSEVDKELFLDNEKLRNIAINSNFGAYTYIVLFINEIVMTLKQFGFKVSRAPQSSTNQLLYLRDTNPKSNICCGIMGLLISKSNSLIKEIDFINESVIEYDFEFLAHKMKLTPPMLRKCLLGALIYFFCHPSTKNKLKYLDSYIENQNEFETEFNKQKLLKQQILADQLEFLRGKFTHDGIDLSFVEDICFYYEFNHQEVLDHCSYLFNNLVLTKKEEVISFPGNKHFQSTRYIMDDVHPRMIKHFCKGDVNEEILYILSKVHDHKYIFFSPKFEFVEFLYVYKVYYVRNIEITISKYLKLFSNFNEKNIDFWF
jgi:hypothetical protein